MSTEQIILDKIRTLPPEKQQEVLDFVEFLQQKTAAQITEKYPPESIDRTREMQWIRENRETFAGQWVALDGDRLLSHGLNAKEVYQAARQSGIKRPLVTQIEPPDQLPFGGWKSCHSN